jgi:hypothetical protein
MRLVDAVVGGRMVLRPDKVTRPEQVKRALGQRAGGVSQRVSKFRRVVEAYTFSASAQSLRLEISSGDPAGPLAKLR